MSNSNHVVSLENGGDRELLDWSWVIETTKVHVLQHNGMQARVLEGTDRSNLLRSLLLNLNALDPVRTLAILKTTELRAATY